MSRLPPPSSSTEHIAGRCRKCILVHGKHCLWGGDTMGGRSPRTQHPSHLAATPSRLSQSECFPTSQSKLPFDATSHQVHRTLQLRVEFLEAVQKDASFLQSWALCSGGEQQLEMFLGQLCCAFHRQWKRYPEIVKATTGKMGDLVSKI